MSQHFNFIKKYLGPDQSSRKDGGFSIIAELKQFEEVENQKEWTDAQIARFRDIRGERQTIHFEDADHRNQLERLDLLASLLPTRPYTAVIEYTDKTQKRKLAVSPAGGDRQINQGVFQERFASLRQYCIEPSETHKRKLYECLHNTKHTYLHGALQKYQQTLQTTNPDQAYIIGKILKRQVEINDTNSEIFNNFVNYCSGERDLFPTERIAPLFDLYRSEDFIILDSTNNTPHVEMAGIRRALSSAGTEGVKVLNVGLAPYIRYSPSTCGGCSAEIDALNHMVNVRIHTTACSPRSIPLEKNYAISANILEAPENQQEFLATHIVRSEFMTSLEERAKFHLDRILEPQTTVSIPTTALDEANTKLVVLLNRFLVELSQVKNIPYTSRVTNIITEEAIPTIQHTDEAGAVSTPIPTLAASPVIAEDPHLTSSPSRVQSLINQSSDIRASVAEYIKPAIETHRKRASREHRNSPQKSIT